MSDNIDFKEIYPDKPTIGQVIGFLDTARVLESAIVSPQTNTFIEACKTVIEKLREEDFTKENIMVREALEELTILRKFKADALEVLGEIDKAGDKCTKLALDTGQAYIEEYCECPLCGGEGEIETDTYMYIDNAALNIQFSGVGEQHVSWHKFLTLCANLRPKIKQVLGE